VISKILSPRGLSKRLSQNGVKNVRRGCCRACEGGRDRTAGNSNFQNLPVDLASLKTDIDSFSALIPVAMDGSEKVIAQKDKQPEVVIQMLRIFGRCIEVNLERRHGGLHVRRFPGGFDGQSSTVSVASAGHPQRRS
jgi:hypothetical protein